MKWAYVLAAMAIALFMPMCFLDRCSNLFLQVNSVLAAVLALMIVGAAGLYGWILHSKRQPGVAGLFGFVAYKTAGPLLLLFALLLMAVLFYF